MSTKAFARGERVLMTDDRLAEIEVGHRDGGLDACKTCATRDGGFVAHPCDAAELIAEVRELRRLLDML